MSSKFIVNGQDMKPEEFFELLAGEARRANRRPGHDIETRLQLLKCPVHGKHPESLKLESDGGAGKLTFCACCEGLRNLVLETADTLQVRLLE